MFPSIRKPVALAALMLCVPALPLSAQQTPDVPKLVETVEVRVINLDVVVTDKKGNPVTGLKQDDFEVYENGTPQKITNFYAVTTDKGKPATAPASAQAPAVPTVTPAEERPDSLKRKIVFFVDNLSLAPFNRNRVFESMKQFAKEAMRPGDEAMIATWNRSMKVRVPFTSDPVQIQQALDSIAGESSYGIQNLSDRRSFESTIRDAEYERALEQARQYAQSVQHDLRQTVTALDGLMSTLAGVDGKKILVITSEGLPIQPGREMFYFIEDLRKQNSKWQGYGSSLLEASSFDSSSIIQSIARTANANGITLYTLHAGGVAGSSVNAAENQQATSFEAERAAISNSTESLQMLADLTGGIATVGTNNFRNAFDRIERDLDTYYSLGYRSGTERVDRQREVQVRVKNRNYVVRSRRTFVEKSLQSEMNDRVIANLFYKSNTNDMKVFTTSQRPQQIEDERFRVPIEVHIPMSSLTLMPQGERMVGSFSVYVVAGDPDGDTSEVSQRTQQLSLTQSEYEALKGKNYTYDLDLIMAKGRNRVSVGVVDDIAATTGFDRLELIAANLQ